MEIPDKLQEDLWKPWGDQKDMFQKFLNGIEIFFPYMKIKSQKRYSAIYFNKTPLVYIEPQRHCIVLGFFSDFIPKRLADETCAFPEWNTARGGLRGLELSGHEKELRRKFGIAGELIFHSVERIRQE